MNELSIGCTFIPVLQIFLKNSIMYYACFLSWVFFIKRYEEVMKFSVCFWWVLDIFFYKIHKNTNVAATMIFFYKKKYFGIWKIVFNQKKLQDDTRFLEFLRFLRTYQWMILYHIVYNDKHYITNCWFLFIHYLIRRILQGKTLPTNSPLDDILLITVQCTSLDSLTIYIFTCGHFKKIWIEFQKFTYNVQAKETRMTYFLYARYKRQIRQDWPCIILYGLITESVLKV